MTGKKQAHAHTRTHARAHSSTRNFKRFSVSDIWIDDTLTRVHPASQIFYSQRAFVLDNIAQAFMHYDV